MKAGLVMAVLAGLASLGCEGSDQHLVSPPGAEAGSIEGRVMAEVDGAPLPGVEVVLRATSMTALTDDQGVFRFGSVPAAPGSTTYVLEVRPSGFEPVAREVALAPGETIIVEIALSPVHAADPESSVAVTSESVDEVRCIAAGDDLSYRVSVANRDSVAIPSIVLYDTLDAGFGRPLSADDIIVERATFPDAVVVVDPDGNSFRVELGDIPPVSPTPAYTVTLPAGSDGGVYCNAVSATGADGQRLARDESCISSTLVIEVDLVNEDGQITGGAFSAAADTFQVGDGGEARPDALVLRVVIVNQGCFAIHEVTLTSIVGARSDAIQLRDVMAGWPDRGTVSGVGPTGLTWTIGTLGSGESAEIRIQAEAVAAGEDVHRVELRFAELAGAITDEEPVVVLP